MLEEEKKLDTEELILAAAIAIFQRDGFDGARMQDIADTAKINKALLHYYYRSKEKLFQAVFGFVFRKMLVEMGSVMNSDTSLEDKIHEFYQKHISFMLKNPYMPGFIIGELNRNPQLVIEAMQQTNVDTVFKGFVEQVRSEVEAGRIIPIDPLQLFINILAMSVFPFGARGMITGLFGLNKEAFEAFVVERKTLCPKLIIDSITIKK